MDDILVIENFLPEVLHKYMLEEITSDAFPLAYLEDVTYDVKNLDGTELPRNHGFCHMFWNRDTGHRSTFVPVVYPLFLYLKEYLNCNPQDLIRMRLGWGLQYSEEKIHNPHLDYNYPHYTCLYYVESSDGDSIVYNETLQDYNPNEDDDLEDIREFPFTIKKRITPEANKMVIFDGKHFHSSSTNHISDRRLVVTTNIEYGR